MDKREATNVVSMLRNQRGMTLIEIMVVIAILGILATAVGIGVVSYLKRSKVGIAQAHVEEVSNALTAYLATEGEYPNSLDDLTSGRNPLLKEKNLKDPWKQELVYQLGGGDGDYELCSKGPDRKQGTDDDVCKD